MFEILIKNLRLTGFHGVNPEEKTKGQEFLFNVSIALDKKSFRRNGTSLFEDNIDSTVNYSDIISIIKEVNNSRKYDLLETLSEVLAEKILAYSKMISGVSVKIEKTSPPIKDNIGSVGVRLQLTGDSERTVFYLSIGSNIGDREKNLRTAVKIIETKDIVEIKKVSSIYETEPMYLKEQEKFYNIILSGTIDAAGYSAFEFLGFLKQIEFQMNRVQSLKKNSPRIIDLDLLFFDNENIKTDILTLPHPAILERNFVLLPLMEIEPQFLINGRKVEELAKELKLKEKVIKIINW